MEKPIVMKSRHGTSMHTKVISSEMGRFCGGYKIKARHLNREWDWHSNKPGYRLNIGRLGLETLFPFHSMTKKLFTENAMIVFGKTEIKTPKSLMDHKLRV